MNATPVTQRIQTTCALGFALLISGTTNASHRAELFDGQANRQGYEIYSNDATGCLATQRPRVTIFEHGTGQAAPTCSKGAQPVTPPAIRLARPLPGSGYNQLNGSIRYSF